MNAFRKVVAYIVTRAHETSSVLSASGATAAIAAWFTGQMTWQHAAIAVAAAVVGYLMPQDKALVTAVAAAVSPEPKAS